MRDGRAEGAVLGALGVDVNPLVIAGGVGKSIDPLLGDLYPVAEAQLLSYRRLQIPGVVEYCSHLLSPPFSCPGARDRTSLQSKHEGPGWRNNGAAPIIAVVTRGGTARGLLADCGLDPARVPLCAGDLGPAQHPALAWARSGAMQLTGRAEGAPQLAPGPLALCADGAAAALRALAPGCLDELNGAALLGERAACAQLSRRGPLSAGGSCRLLPCSDGWLAVNLARSDDLAALAAWLQLETAPPSSTASAWPLLEHELDHRSCGPLLERAELLGLPVSRVTRPAAIAPPWIRFAQGITTLNGATLNGATLDRLALDRLTLAANPPLVVDLSSLWAGPLCAQLLADCGARVIKVESVRRPDGARQGPPRFYDLLNHGKQSVALDFADDGDLALLRSLLEVADVVVENSRPRALEQLGISAGELLLRRPGLLWIAITGHGRESGRVAFGDDAGAAAGLCPWVDGDHPAKNDDGEQQQPLFCGDAVADPLAGLHAAVATVALRRAGRGGLVDLSLASVAAHCVGATANAADCCADIEVSRCADGWQVVVDDQRALVAPAQARSNGRRAATLGHDTPAVRAWLANSGATESTCS